MVSSNKSKEILSFIKSLVYLIILFFLIRGSIIQAFQIPSGSMKPTLMIGDYILATKFNYGFRLPFITNTIWQYSTPRRGDVVIFTRPDEEETLEMNEDKTHFVKRVLGLPGEKIEIRKSQVFINDQEYKDTNEVWWEDGGRENFGPVTVPADSIFLLGDNRDRSRDSRYWKPSNFLKINRVEGKALIIYWSFFSLRRIGTLIY